MNTYQNPVAGNKQLLVVTAQKEALSALLTQLVVMTQGSRSWPPLSVEQHPMNDAGVLYAQTSG